MKLHPHLDIGLSKVIRLETQSIVFMYSLASYACQTMSIYGKMIFIEVTRRAKPNAIERVDRSQRIRVMYFRRGG